MRIIPLGIGSRVKHPEHGLGVITGINFNTYDITFIEHGSMLIKKEDSANCEIIERIDTDDDMVSLFDVGQLLESLLKKWADVQEVIPLGERWEGGTLIMKPKDPGLKPKEIPIEVFFHKIVMVRDRLRVMEQRINSSKNLSDEEKVNLQQYITRIYGSLTSFNVLFRLKEDNFVGERGD